MTASASDPLVCLVDDDLSVLKSLSRLLDVHRYRVATFASPDEFLRGEDAARADCLVLDIHMPGMSGLEVQAALNAAGSALPVVFLTGHGDDRQRAIALAAGAVEFLEKPVTSDDLLKAIETALLVRSHPSPPRPP
jgi:FixJ family two-component response regulator